MKPTPPKNEKPQIRYISQKRNQHDRKPAFDFILPSPNNKEAWIRTTYNLKDSKMHKRIVSTCSRPVTGKTKQSEQKRNSGSRLKNSSNQEIPKSMLLTDKVNLSRSLKKSSFSSPNSRYKTPLTDRQKVKEQKYDFLSPAIKSDKEQKPQVFKGVSTKQPQSPIFQFKREVSPRYQRLLSQTPPSFFKPRHSKKLSNNSIQKSLKKQSLNKSNPKTMIKSHSLVKQANIFEYTLHYSYRTKKGFTPNNPNKPNQDSFVICPSIQGKTWQHYFGINDGHGVFGHMVSSHLKNSLSKNFTQSNFQPTNPQQTLLSIYQKVNKQLTDSDIDLCFSGSTMVGCFMKNDKVYCCNVGDSRAVMGYQENGQWQVRQLSRDHKPSIQEEAERILKAGGRVQPYQDPEGNFLGPLRVWIKDDQVPGLAMTRSFGDLVAAAVGVTSQPQITEFTLSTNDRILIVASDGVWQFLQNEEIMKKLGQFYSQNKLQEACNWLLAESTATWKRQCSSVDDITFIILFLTYE